MKKSKKSYSTTEKFLDEAIKPLGLKVTGKQLLADAEMRDIMLRMMESELAVAKK